MTIDSLAPRESTDLAADERWAVWIAKNVEQDRRTRNFSIAFAAAVGVSLAIAFAVTLVRLA